MDDEWIKAWGNADPDKSTNPFLELWSAVFRLGVIDAAHDWANDRPHKPAVAWVFSNDNFVGSFVWICDLFGLNPELARGKLLLKRREIYAKNKGVPQDD